MNIIIIVFDEGIMMDIEHKLPEKCDRVLQYK